ncbi:Serine/threonine-protein kinase B [Rickettsia monacensis]|uniref:Serine/threonine-protein kinase B n=1 Tax=Rickettsia monacensis TaxID=109232 RepID=A0A0B7J146_9RICK|nr:pentapeptide repeat-containing protein [Rickettsia monacensis]CDI29904.1 Serine/threonine-protein kinase B [Rickettsia monacensis IrR/Munich]CEO17796.1 Serine/threonine-protein kinase B [Rickettsia monacensis]
MTNLNVYKCEEKDLNDYLGYIKDNPNVSLNDFIKNKYYFAEDNDKIIITSLENMEINADLANANFQGTILTDAVFNNCDLTNTILCDSNLTNVKFNDCIFIGTDFRGANLHYTDFNYEDNDEGKIPNLKDKIRDIKLSFSNLERLNKYIDKDLEKERIKEIVVDEVTKKKKYILATEDEETLHTVKSRELKTKQEELETLKQNLDNPGIATNLLNAFWNSAETIAQNRQNELEKINKLQHEVNKLETEVYALDNLRMFCGNGLADIFEQLKDEKIQIKLDSSYVIGSTAKERDIPKEYIKLTSQEFDLYLAEAAKQSNTKLSLTDFVRKQKNLSKDTHIIPDLSEIDLSGKTLTNLNLKNTLFASANLENIKISNCNLDFTNFEGANLQNAVFQNVTARNTGFLFADLKNSKIENSDMSRAYMPKVDLSEAEVTNSKFNAVMMVNADAEKLIIKDSEWKNSNLTGISLAYADMQRVQMQGVVLNNALLDQANIVSTDLENAFMNKTHALEAKFKEQCNMQGITARNAYFSDAEFENILSLKEADLREAIMQRVKLKNADLTKAKLDKAKLEYADLTNATLTNATAQFAKLSNATLEKAEAEGLNISDAIAKNINAKEANFKNAIMQRADLTKADFTKAVLENADMQAMEATEAIFKEANLKQANLKAANLAGINKEGADFDKAKIDDATKMHDTKGEAKGNLDHQDKDGKKTSVNVNEHAKLQDKIHAREKSGWFLKTGVGQFCTKIAKSTTSGISSVTNFLASKKFLVGLAVVAGLAVAAAPFVAMPVLLVTGTALATKTVILGAGILAGGLVATGTYKLTQKLLRNLQKSFENLTSSIDKYISPPPENIDELVTEKQQARQKAETEKSKEREENLNNVNNNIDKAKEQDILKQAQNNLNQETPKVEIKEKKDKTVEKQQTKSNTFAAKFKPNTKGKGFAEKIKVEQKIKGNKRAYN